MTEEEKHLDFFIQRQRSLTYYKEQLNISLKNIDDSPLLQTRRNGITKFNTATNITLRLAKKTLDTFFNSATMDVMVAAATTCRQLKTDIQGALLLEQHLPVFSFKACTVKRVLDDASLSRKKCGIH